MKCLCIRATRPTSKPAATPIVPPVAAAPIVPRPATPQEIRAACPGASDAFVLEQVEGQATAAQVASAWCAELQGQVNDLAAKLTASQQEVAECRSQLEAAAGRRR